MKGLSTSQTKIIEQCSRFADDIIGVFKETTPSNKRTAKWNKQNGLPDLVVVPILSQFNLNLVQGVHGAQDEVISNSILTSSPPYLIN
jgi:hypothetical protein